MIEIPEYTSGAFKLFEVKNDETKDFPEEVLKDKGMKPIWFREISVFDRLRYEFDQSGVEITLKIRIPKFNGISAGDVCLIEGKQHLVYNATHVQDRYGFPETELTLTRPKKELRIL